MEPDRLLRRIHLWKKPYLGRSVCMYVCMYVCMLYGDMYVLLLCGYVSDCVGTLLCMYFTM